MILNDLNHMLLVIISIATIVGASITVFMIIRYQMVKFLQEEIRAYKDKVSRLEDDIEDFKKQLATIHHENQALIKERDYLRNLIISALTTKKSIDQNLSKELSISIK